MVGLRKGTIYTEMVNAIKVQYASMIGLHKGTIYTEMGIPLKYIILEWYRPTQRDHLH
jgi:hypothetical protein